MAGIALSSAVEVRLACLWIASDHVLNLQFGAAAQGVVDLLVQEMGEVSQLLGFEARCCLSALQCMAFRQKLTDSVSIAIAQHTERTKQDGPLLVRRQP